MADLDFQKLSKIIVPPSSGRLCPPKQKEMTCTCELAWHNPWCVVSEKCMVWEVCMNKLTHAFVSKCMNYLWKHAQVGLGWEGDYHRISFCNFKREPSAFIPLPKTKLKHTVYKSI